jgi:uncharacterized phage protein gp47/JayE
MPVENGEYIQRTEQEIRTALENELIKEFGADIDLTESSAFSTIIDVLASVSSNNQEQSLEEVYESAFLDTATGIDLERVVSIIGLQRRSAVNATGVQRFIASSPVTQDYTIQRGTTVQTAGDEPVEFETTESTLLELIDDFSSGDVTKYSGDTSNASVVSDANAVRGNNVLELDSTANAFIYDSELTFDQGTTFHCYVKPENNTVPAVLFGLNSDNPTNYYQIAFDETDNQVRLEVVENGSVTTTVDTLSATITSSAFHEVEFDWNITNNIGITVFDPNENKLGTLGDADNTYTSGSVGFKSIDANNTKRFDFYTTSETSANIRAKEGGVVGNVGPNSVTVTPSPPNGVQETKNLYPVGDTNYEDTNQEVFAFGNDEESDEELRERAKNAVTDGGDATHDAIVSKLLNDVENVTSVKLYENNTDIDNTQSGGLPAYSFEAVVFGGSDENVAEAIFDKKAVTSRDYGGANGIKVEQTVTSDSNNQTRNIEFTRPSEVQIDITLDLVVDDTYIGNEKLRNEITKYIGGVLSDGSEVIGLDVAENVRLDRIKDVIIGPNTGVIGLDQSVDGTPVETVPSKTTVDGLEIIEVGENEVAQTDASDSSITINKRTI